MGVVEKWVFQRSLSIVLKIAHARFFMLPFRKEESIILYSGFLGDFSDHPEAFPFPLPVNHSVKVEGPVRKRGAKVTMAHRRERGHGLPNLGDLIFRNSPDDHGIAPEACFLMAQDSPETPDHSPADENIDSAQKPLFVPTGLPSGRLKRGQNEGKVSLNLAQKFLVLRRKL